VQRFIHPLLINVAAFGLPQITETLEYFLALTRPKLGQQLQDFSFAHG